MTLLVTALSGCGELRPEAAATYARERQEQEDRQNPPKIPTLVVNNITYDSTGATDLRYLISFNSGAKTFSFQVSRTAWGPTSKTISVSRSNMPAQFDLLVSVFAGKVGITVDTQCTTDCPVSSAELLRSDTGVSMSTPNPFVADGNGNLFTNLNHFILNHL